MNITNLHASSLSFSLWAYVVIQPMKLPTPMKAVPIVTVLLLLVSTVPAAGQSPGIPTTSEDSVHLENGDDIVIDKVQLDNTVYKGVVIDLNKTDQSRTFTFNEIRYDYKYIVATYDDPQQTNFEPPTFWGQPIPGLTQVMETVYELRQTINRIMTVVKIIRQGIEVAQLIMMLFGI